MEKLNNMNNTLDARLAYYHFEATRLQRFIHVVVDGMVIYTTVYFLMVVAAMLGLDPPSPNSEDGKWVFRICFIITSVVLYTILEYSSQRSLGKYLTGTKVISLKGRPLTFGQSLLRSLLRFFPFDAFTFLAHAKWHDSWSKTMVVSNAFPQDYAEE
jgi:uncharacterized RDD family membrane protein YckC